MRRLRTVNREQLRVLRGRLTNAGVPTSRHRRRRRAGPTPSAAGVTGTPHPGLRTSSAADRPVRTRKALAALLDSLGPDDWAALTTATTGTRELLAAAYGPAPRRRRAARPGRRARPRPARRRPTVVARTQPLVYAFEVVAAQSAGDQRRTAEETLAALVRLEIAVSGTSSTTPAGWALPFPVTTPAAARRLATETLVVRRRRGHRGRRPAARRAASLEDVARWSANVQALAVDWDVPLTAFPGASA